MYNSRRVGRLRPERNKLKDEVAGVALGSVREGSARPRPGAAPPPSLQHHQMKRPSIAPDTLASELTKNDALNSAREQTKKQLESITGRMFQVSGRHPANCIFPTSDMLCCSGAERL